MSIIFSWTGDDGLPANWTGLNYDAYPVVPPTPDPTPYGPHIVPGAGCDGGAAFTCSGVTDIGGYAMKQLDPELVNQDITIRARVAFFSDGSPVMVGSYFSLMVIEGFVPPIVTRFNPSGGRYLMLGIIVDVQVDGAFRVNVLGDTIQPFDHVSAPGLVPIDALPHGIQVILHFPGDANPDHSLTVEFTFVVDNAVVYTFTSTQTPHPTLGPTPPCLAWLPTWGYCTEYSNNPMVGFCCIAHTRESRVSQVLVYQTRYYGCGYRPDLDPEVNKGLVNGLSAVSHVEIEDDSVIADYPGCDAEPLAANTCWNPVVVETEVCDDETNTLTFTGSGFAGGRAPEAGDPTVQLYGPGGGQIGFFDIDFTDTQIVLSGLFQSQEHGPALPFTVVPGRYCIHIFNKCA